MIDRTTRSILADRSPAPQLVVDPICVDSTSDGGTFERAWLDVDMAVAAPVRLSTQSVNGCSWSVRIAAPV